MGCDYTVHIWDKSKFDEDVLMVFHGSSLGSKYFSFGQTVGVHRDQEEILKKKYGKDSYRIIAETPQYNMGEVSFLKQALTGDDDYLYGKDDYVKLFNGDPEPITEELIERTSNIDKELGKFLEEHKEYECFTVCW